MVGFAIPCCNHVYSESMEKGKGEVKTPATCKKKKKNFIMRPVHSSCSHKLSSGSTCWSDNKIVIYTIVPS